MNDFERSLEQAKALLLLARAKLNTAIQAVDPNAAPAIYFALADARSDLADGEQAIRTAIDAMDTQASSGGAV